MADRRGGGSIAGRAWPFFAGAALIMVAHGLQGTLIALRAVFEGFPTAATGVVMSGYFVGMLAGSTLSPALVRQVGHVSGNPHGGGLVVGGAARVKPPRGDQGFRRLGTQRVATPSMTTFSPMEQTTSQVALFTSGSTSLTVTRVWTVSPMRTGARKLRFWLR